MYNLNSKLSVVLLVMVLSSTMQGQDLNQYRKATYFGEQQNDSLNYVILLPKGYTKNKAYPLLLFLHGSGERGNDNRAQLTHGGHLFANDSIREKHPAIVVFPQCPAGKSWHNGQYQYTNGQGSYSYPATVGPNKQQDLLMGLLNQLQEQYTVDSNRIYIGGLSMGAMGTFELVRRNPTTFAAAFAICGGANPAIVPVIKDTPWWIFHGTADTIVPYEYSLAISEALKRAGALVKLTLYQGVGHDSWTNTFAEPDLLNWVFSKNRAH